MLDAMPMPVLLDCETTEPAIRRVHFEDSGVHVRAALAAAIRAVDAIPHAARDVDDDASRAATIVMEPEDVATVIDSGHRPGQPRNIDFRGVTLRLF
jgi:predicted RNase H-like nuclease (RuvC/YqgF family)